MIYSEEYQLSESNGLSFDYILFGGSGDLALRKLLPALYRLHCNQPFAKSTQIIAVSRSDIPLADYCDQVKQGINNFIPKDQWDVDRWNTFREHLKFCALDATEPQSFAPLGKALGSNDSRTRVFFLSTHSKLFAPIAENLGINGLITSNSRLVLEKPIGKDKDTAASIDNKVSKHFNEAQIYRIDHYLGKETVQNLNVLRFANPLFESLWNHNYIDHIQITIAESIGVEGRASFYEGTGALRDIVQNHLLQLLCIAAMEPPSNLHPDSVRDEKLKVLRSLRPLSERDVRKHVVRGQYVDGRIKGQKHPGYLKEEGVASDSHTETFVAMKVKIDNMRWAKVPFYLRTGKRLPKRACEIVVQFKAIPHWLFKNSPGQLMSNQLVITLQPKESITLRLCGKRIGPGMDVRTIDLNLNPESRSSKYMPEAYERLILDVIKGDPTLFLRQDELEAAWRWVDPILKGWDSTSSPPEAYASGSWGPPASTMLMAQDGRLWYEDVI